MKSFHRYSLSIIVTLAAGATSFATDVPPSRHFILLFGGQADVLKPTTAHVWAIYVKTTCLPDGTQAVEETTISWLPVAGKVRPLSRRPEPGRNYTIAETFEFMSGPRQRIALWGPYEISECRYEQAVRYKAVLDSGAVLYKVNDWFDRRADVHHCLHGVTAAHPDLHERCRVVRWYGEAGTAPVASAMLSIGMIREPECTHDWVLPLVGLDGQKFVRRTAGDGVLIQR